MTKHYCDRCGLEIETQNALVIRTTRPEKTLYCKDICALCIKLIMNYIHSNNPR